MKKKIYINLHFGLTKTRKKNEMPCHFFTNSVLFMKACKNDERFYE